MVRDKGIGAQRLNMIQPGVDFLEARRGVDVKSLVGALRRSPG